MMKANDPRDPVKRDVEKGDHDEPPSPFAPPDAYAPPGAGQSVPYEAMHPVLQALRDEHVETLAELTAFESTLDAITKTGPGGGSDDGLRRFFTHVEHHLLPHNRREEEALFPLLRRKLLESGEHSKGRNKRTAIDIMTGDHVEFIQLSAVMTNFFRLAPLLHDERSRLFVVDSAVRQGRTLIEMLRLHIFREDEVVFSLAHNLMTTEEFDALGS